jgi:F-type H+-transporting ATPase subunit delta
MAKKVNINELARRYTTAALQLAKATNKLDAVAADLIKLQDALKADEGAQRLFSSPLLTAQKQVAAAREIAKNLGITDVSQNLLLVIARNRRLKYLSQIIEVTLERIATLKGEQKIVVTSAVKLDEASLNALAANFVKKTGKKITVEEKLDESIIGGVIVKIGSEMYDNSVKTQLTAIKNELKKTA